MTCLRTRYYREQETSIDTLCDESRGKWSVNRQRGRDRKGSSKSSKECPEAVSLKAQESDWSTGLSVVIESISVEA